MLFPSCKNWFYKNTFCAVKYTSKYVFVHWARWNFEVSGRKNVSNNIVMISGMEYLAQSSAFRKEHSGVWNILHIVHRIGQSTIPHHAPPSPFTYTGHTSCPLQSSRQWISKLSLTYHGAGSSAHIGSQTCFFPIFLYDMMFHLFLAPFSADP